MRCAGPRKVRPWRPGVGGGIKDLRSGVQQIVGALGVFASGRQDAAVRQQGEAGIGSSRRHAACGSPCASLRVVDLRVGKLLLNLLTIEHSAVRQLHRRDLPIPRGMASAGGERSENEQPSVRQLDGVVGSVVGFNGTDEGPFIGGRIVDLSMRRGVRGIVDHRAKGNHAPITQQEEPLVRGRLLQAGRRPPSLRGGVIDLDCLHHFRSGKCVSVAKVQAACGQDPAVLQQNQMWVGPSGSGAGNRRPRIPGGIKDAGHACNAALDFSQPHKQDPAVGQRDG